MWNIAWNSINLIFTLNPILMSIQKFIFSKSCQVVFEKWCNAHDTLHSWGVLPSVASYIAQVLWTLVLIFSHLSTAVDWREKMFKHFVFYKYFSLVLGLLKYRISEKINQALLRKPDFRLFHYKTRVQLVSKITTIATRNRCYM